MTSFAEGPTKLIEHAAPFSFFDRSVVGDEIRVLSLMSMVTPDPEVVAGTIGRAIRDANARLVLIDGFQGLELAFADPTVGRTALAYLATQIEYLDTTLVVTLEGSVGDAALNRTLTTADTVLALEYSIDGWRDSRRLSVVKQRGRAPLSGMHAYTIDETGVVVYPRIESLPVPSPRTPRFGRVPFGLSELDILFDGGPIAGTVTIVAGVLGTGKTTIALHWALEGVAAGQATVFASFREDEEHLREHAEAFGQGVDVAAASGKLVLLPLSPVELNPDAVAARLLDVVEQAGAERLVVDDLMALQLELGQRARHYFHSLKAQLQARGVSSLFVLEPEVFGGFRLDQRDLLLARIGDNVVMVQQQEAAGAIHRVLALLKVRNSAYDASLREVVIEPTGVRVLTPAETAPGVLSEAAEETGGVAPPQRPGGSAQQSSAPSEGGSDK